MKSIALGFSGFVIYFIFSSICFAGQESTKHDVLYCTKSAQQNGRSGDFSFMQTCLGSTIQPKAKSNYKFTMPDANVTKQLRDSSDNRNN